MTSPEIIKDYGADLGNLGYQILCEQDLMVLKDPKKKGGIVVCPIVGKFVRIDGNGHCLNKCISNTAPKN